MNHLHAILLFAAIALAQFFLGGGTGGGTPLILMLPSFLLLGISGILALATFWKASARMDRCSLLTAILLGVFMLVRIALSPSPWVAQPDFFAAVASLLVYFLTALFIRGSHARSLVVFGLLVLSLAQVALGIYQFANGSNYHPLVPEGLRHAGSRATGFFANGNHLAGFLEAALLLAVSLCLWGGFRAIGRMLIGYVVLACLVGLLLTGSRGGYLSAATGFAIFATMSIWTLRARLAHGLVPRLIAIASAVVLLGGALAWAAHRNYALRERANTVFVGTDVRFNYWEAAWKQFQLAPAFGTGSRTYLYYGRMFRGPQVLHDPVFAHSDWLQLLAEYGIVGMLLTVGFVFTHLRHGWRRWQRMVTRHSQGITHTEEARSLALQLGAISAITALLVHAVLDFNFHIPANLLLTAFLFGLLASRRPSSDEGSPGWPQRALHALPACLGLWMLSLSAPKLRGELLAERARRDFMASRVESMLANAEQAISLGTRNPELYFQVGEVKRILRLFTDNDAEKLADLRQAHEAYAQAIAIFPQDVFTVLRDAWALSRLGRFEEAEPLIARAKELDPNSPMPWIYAALHWHLRGRHAEALADYRRSEILGSGYIPVLLDEIFEKLDAQELEKLAKTDRPAP